MFNVKNVCPILSRIQIADTAPGILNSVVKKGSLGWISHLKTTIGQSKIVYLTYKIVFYRFGAYGKPRISPVDIGPYAIEQTKSPFLAVESCVIDVKSLSNEALLSYMMAAEIFLSTVARSIDDKSTKSFFLRQGTALLKLKEVAARYDDDPVNAIETLCNPMMVERILMELRMYQTYIAKPLRLYGADVLAKLVTM